MTTEKPYKISVKVTSPSGPVVFLQRTWFWDNQTDLADIMSCYEEWIQEMVAKYESELVSAQNGK